jgi:flagellar hook assembly protein FlgD
MIDRLRALSARLEAPRVRPVLLVSLVLFLIAGSAAAFAVAERLKLERSPVAKPRIQRIVGPTCECPKANARLTFTLRHADRVTASILDLNGRRVRIVVADEPHKAGPVVFLWDGRTDDGKVAHDGRYRWRLGFGRAHRTITIPTPVRVDTRPPRVRLISATPRVFSPDGDGEADRVLYRYRSSELGRAQVFVDGSRVVRARRSAGVSQVRWRGRVNGEIAPVGTYPTWLTVVDAAGNESRPTRTVTVRIRYVGLANVPASVRRGGFLVFRIDADAKQVFWSFRGLLPGVPSIHGVSAPGVVRVRLPNRLRPGTYELDAAIPAGEDRETLTVRP